MLHLQIQPEPVNTAQHRNIIFLERDLDLVFPSFFALKTPVLIEVSVVPFAGDQNSKRRLCSHLEQRGSLGDVFPDPFCSNIHQEYAIDVIFSQ